MIREKNIVMRSGRAFDTKPNTVKGMRKSELSRIENENKQLRAQKRHLKAALKAVIRQQDFNTSNPRHIADMKQVASDALSKLVNMEESSNVN